MIIMSDFYAAKYRNGEEYTRKVAATALASRFESFGCIFPQSMLDLVPPTGFTITPLPDYPDEGGEPAYTVSSV